MYYCKKCKNAEMHVQIQYFKEYRLVHVVTCRNQNLLNMQKIAHWSANNAILLIKGIYNNSVLNQ